jgi:transcriptional regulator with PAS, ATPase and Fis domain
VEDAGSKNGTWIGGKRVARKLLADGDVLLVGHTALLYRETGGEAGDLDAFPGGEAGLATMSPALAAAFEGAARAAASKVPIEITGESGTGKELIARAIHALSGRSGKLVAVNCGAMPAQLLEGELFGHKKGAYTGAEGDRLGLVRTADGGTLFLDEIAELPGPSQAALLRVLQEGEVTPLGADRPVKVDVRLVTATHRSIDAEVQLKRFRADLRARLLGVTVALPPLRERLEDLGPIAAKLLPREVAFAADAVAALYAHGWPLNIRELERTLAAAAALAGDRIELEHLPAALRGDAGGDGEVEVDPDTLTDDERALRELLREAIAKHTGNLAAVAKELGKDRTQIRRWMKRFGLSRDD